MHTFLGIPQLQIKNSSALVRIGRRDVRGLRKAEMNLEAMEEGSLCEWTLLDLPYDANFIMNPGAQVSFTYLLLILYLVS